MKVKIIMDSGREYIVDGYINNVTDRCFNYNRLPMSNSSISIMKNDFVELCDGVFINPSHISSIEEVI